MQGPSHGPGGEPWPRGTHWTHRASWVRRPSLGQLGEGQTGGPTPALPVEQSSESPPPHDSPPATTEACNYGLCLLLQAGPYQPSRAGPGGDSGGPPSHSGAGAQWHAIRARLRHRWQPATSPEVGCGSRKAHHSLPEQPRLLPFKPFSRSGVLTIQHIPEGATLTPAPPGNPLRRCPRGQGRPGGQLSAVTASRRSLRWVKGGKGRRGKDIPRDCSGG